MTVSVHQLFQKFGLEYSEPVQWGTRLNARYNGVYVISNSPDPFSVEPINPEFRLNETIIEDWKEEAAQLEIEGQRNPSNHEIENYLAEFWKPDQNILYIGMSASNTNPIQKRVRQFYQHKVGKKGPHTGGYWLKLLQDLETTYIYHAQTENPRDIEFKMLLAFAELSSEMSFYDMDRIGDNLPFANLTADFYKSHTIKNHTNRNSRTAN